jgi:hypothetical protein
MPRENMKHVRLVVSGNKSEDIKQENYGLYKGRLPEKRSDNNENVTQIYRVFQNKLYNFERVYKSIQKTCTVIEMT